MKRIPAYLLRNMDVTVGGDEKVGQVSEFGEPQIKQKLEKVWNAGMIKEREYAVGHEVEMTEFKMTAYDPATLKLYGIGVGRDTELVLSKALADEDGIWHSATITVRGKMAEIKVGKTENGKKHETEYKFTTNYLHIVIDGDEILEIDDFSLRVGGVDLYADMKRALGRA